MLLAYDNDGLVLHFLGFRDNYTNEMIDALQPFEGFHNYRIYDKEMIDRIHEAIDTGGMVRVDLDSEGIYLGLIIENGSSEPAPDVPFEPDRTPIEILQEENAQLWHDSMMKELAIRATMEETAELWHENMLLDAKLNIETSAIWYELMTGGIG